MDAEKLLKRNEERAGVYRFEGSLLPMEKQRGLCEEFLAPHTEEIAADLLTLRAKADEEIQQKEKSNPTEYTSPYPVGRCLEITEAVFSDIVANIDNPTFVGVRALRKFIKEGGMVRVVWTIQDGTHFQNAIQAGSYLLNVAGRTVEGTKYLADVSIHENPKADGFETIRTIERFAEVAEEYWHCRVYPNIYMPAIAPMFPVLLRKPLHRRNEPNQQYDKDGLFLSGGTRALFSINFALRDEHGFLFEPTHDFLFNSKYTDRRLPKEAYEGLLDNRYLQFLHKHTGKEFSVSDDPDAAKEYLQAHYHGDPETWNETLEKIGEMLKLGKKLDTYPLAIFPRSAQDNEEAE